MLKNDPLKRVLYVDLTNRRYWVKEREDLFNKYLGGTGVAIKLLFEECPKGADPLGPRNPIIFAVGPFNAVFPTASKTVAMFKSPLTGNLGESHAGGRSSIAIRSAGYGAIVIKGVSETPVYLVITSDKVQFKNAETLWGMASSYTVGRVLRDAEKGAGNRTIMRIGRAGENLVRYAGVVTETYRHFGRLGLGAVFGSKKLKALVIAGKNTIPVKSPSTYRKVYQMLFDKITKSSAMKKYHDIGTPVNILSLNEIGALPTENLQKTKFEFAEIISGENLAAKYLARRIACSHCPVACIHLATLREPYEDEPYYYKTTFVSYDYEPLFALGTMLGLHDVNGFLKLLELVEIYGLDAMSTGVALAWATEAFNRGLIGTAETMGLSPKWGDYKIYRAMVKHLVNLDNEFYYALAQGVDFASEKYGGQEFAMAFGKNEMPGYHTGPAADIGFLIGARHSHLDNAGYSLDQKTLGKELSAKEIVDHLIKEEEWRQILSSLVVCFFARGVYKPKEILEALDVMGYNLTEEQLYEIGSEIYKLKYEYKVREGFKVSSLRLPKRMFETPTPHGKLTPQRIKEALNYFAKQMGIE